MTQGKEPGNGKKYNTRLILISIMIGFIVLAGIEILFGIVQLKSQNERLAKEEENRVMMEEIKAKLEQETYSEVMDSSKIKTEADSQNEESYSAQTVESKPDETNHEDQTTGTPPVINDSGELQIVFLGDSMMDFDRGDNSIPELICEMCDATGYNMGIGGTTATPLRGDDLGYDSCTSWSGYGISHIITGDISADSIKGLDAYEAYSQCDFSQTDYFVICYGTNDFLAQIPPTFYQSDGVNIWPHFDLELNTYGPAIQNIVGDLLNTYPNAKALVITPHYCEIYAGQVFCGDAYSVDYGYGNLETYVSACQYAVNQCGDRAMVYNAFQDSGVNAYTANEYLRDGIHLTEAGRRSYAEGAARIINEDLGIQ